MPSAGVSLKAPDRGVKIRRGLCLPLKAQCFIMIFLRHAQTLRTFSCINKNITTSLRNSNYRCVITSSVLLRTCMGKRCRQVPTSCWRAEVLVGLVGTKCPLDQTGGSLKPPPCAVTQPWVHTSHVYLKSLSVGKASTHQMRKIKTPILA